MNIIYCVSELLDWIDVAKHFSTTKDWQPKLWLTTSKNKNYCKKIFPDIETIDFFEANRGILQDINLDKEIIVDYNIIIKYLKYEKIAVKMMDRMDSSGYTFNYSERTQLYYIVLEFVLNYLKLNKIDILFFSESPHSVLTYLFYAVALEEDIKILRLSPTHIMANTFLTSSLEKKQLYFTDIYNQVVEDKTISDNIENYFKKINGNYDEASPYYMDKIIKSNHQKQPIKIVKSVLKTIEYYFKSKPRLSYNKNTAYHNIKYQISNKNYALSIIRNTLYKIKLQKEYNKYVQLTSKSFDLNDRFIYFPIQYQPEKSTSPEGDIFVDQYLAINMLSKISQGRFKIYVKEHISQFSSKLKGEQGRTLSFYDDLSLLDNIVFVDTSISSFLLIDNALSVSTITGTAGFESVIRGKPSIIFGHPWYKECQSVFKVDNADDLEIIVNSILDNYKVDILKTKYFLEAIFSISERIYINNSNKNSIKDKNHSNLSSIIKLIERYEDKVS